MCLSPLLAISTSMMLWLPSKVVDVFVRSVFQPSMPEMTNDEIDDLLKDIFP